MPSRSVVGIKQRTTLEPILKLDGFRVVAQANLVQFSSSVDYVGDVNAIGEATQVSSMSQVLSSTSLVNVCEAALISPVWANVFLNSSSVIAECITNHFPYGPVGTGGGIDLYDEGVLVVAAATHINIVGADARVDVEGTGGKIWHPAPNYSSNFNTLSGTTNAVVPDITTSNRYVSSPTVEGVPFYTGGGAPWGGDGSTHPCTRTAVLSWATPQACLFDDLTTTFTIVISDSSGTIDSYTTPAISGNGINISPSTEISVTISSWAADSDKFSAIVSVSVDIASLLPNSGYFDIAIQHSNATQGLFTKTQ